MENENMKQRVSILKPRKTRLPLGELDLGNQDSDEQVPNENKTIRRVSFASNNFIKPFVADPEKNTIWDLTYEESIEKSDSSQFARTNNVNKKDVCDCLNVTTINTDGDEMDITTLVGNYISVTPNPGNKITANIGTQNVNYVKNNTNMCCKDEMELTSVVNSGNININNEENTIDDLQVTMEETEMVSVLIRETSQNILIATDDIEKQDSCNLETSVTMYNKESNISNLDVTVEETEMIPVLIRETSQNILMATDDIEKHNICNESNITNLSVTMEETEMIPILISEKSHNMSTTTENNNIPDTNNLEVSMDNTGVVPILIDVRPEDISVISENVLPYTESLCTSYDDTENLINYNLSNPKKSDFSKVIAGDLNPPFSSLAQMPLRGINSTSFVESCVREERPLTCQKNDDEKENLIPQVDDVEMLSIAEVNSNTSTSVTSSQNNTASESKSMESDGNLSNVACAFPIGCSVEPIDTEWMDSFQKKLAHTKTKRIEFFKSLDNKLQKVSKLYETKMQKYNEIQDMLTCYENKLKIIATNDKSTDEPKILSWKDKISELYERSEEYWKVLSLDDDLLKFSTLYGVIAFNVQVNNDGQVLNIHLENRICDEKSQIIALYVNKLFMEKLKLETIQLALGVKFDILSLLDYVRLTMENLLTIDTQFTYLSITYGVSMDRQFNVTFAIIAVNSMFSWRFAVNASDYENISPESVTYHAKIGDLRERDIKKCMQDCPQGFAFIQMFVENLHNLVETLENKLK